jgi:hypothetical protein
MIVLICIEEAKVTGVDLWSVESSTVCPLYSLSVCMRAPIILDVA